MYNKFAWLPPSRVRSCDTPAISWIAGVFYLKRDVCFLRKITLNYRIPLDKIQMVCYTNRES